MLTYTDYVDFGNGQNSSGHFAWSKSDSIYLNVTFKVFQKGDNKEFQLVQNLTMGEADFNQLMRLRNQLVIAADNFARGEDLSSVLIPTMSNDMDEQLKPAHNLV